MLQLCKSQVPAWLPHRTTWCPQFQVSSSFWFQFHFLYLRFLTLWLLGEKEECVHGSFTGGNHLLWVLALIFQLERGSSPGKVLILLLVSHSLLSFLFSWLNTNRCPTLWWCAGPSREALLHSFVLGIGRRIRET